MHSPSVPREDVARSHHCRCATPVLIGVAAACQLILMDNEQLNLGLRYRNASAFAFLNAAHVMPADCVA